MNAIDTLLTFINKVAPNGAVQLAFIDLLNKSRSEGNSDEVVYVQLMFACIDGLKYGNWPGK